MASYAKSFEANYETFKGNGREWIGTAPPPSSVRATKPGEKWVITNSNRLQRAPNPKTGSTFENVPTWSLLDFSKPAETKAEAKKEAPAAAAPAVASQTAVADEDLNRRRTAYEQAKQYQAENDPVARTPYPTDTNAPEYYSDLNAYGKAYVDKYLLGQETEKRKAELAVKENAFYGNMGLQRIDPKKMAVSRPTTFDETVAQMERLRKMIA